MFSAHSHRMQWSFWSYEGFKDITVLLWGNQTWFSMLFQCLCHVFKGKLPGAQNRSRQQRERALVLTKDIFLFFYPHKSKFLPDVAFIREINWLYMGVTFTTINHCSNTSVLTFYSKRVSKTSSWILFVNSRHFKILSVCTIWFILSHSFSFH